MRRNNQNIELNRVLNHPFEMVEVAVSARQGDSGGPILNSRGELAGVLFGEGHGRTSGSYCGRVKWFLSSVTPGPTRLPGTADAPALARVRSMKSSRWWIYRA